MHHYIHADDATLEQHSRIVDLIRTVLKGQQRIMATLDELKQLAQDTKAAVDEMGTAVDDMGTAVDAIPPAIDNLEALITAGGLNAANQAKVDDAFDALRGLVDKAAAARDKANAARDTLNTAAQDAADGIDEAAGGTPPTP